MGTTLRTLVVLAVLLLSACASRRWKNTSKSQREFYRDKAKCSAEAGQAAGNYDPYGIVWDDTFSSCMYGEGWTLVDG